MKIDPQTITGLSEEAMVAEEIVNQIHALKGMGYPIKRVAREVGVARNTVRRYWGDASPGIQSRPAARVLTSAQAARAEALYRTTAEGNAVVVQDLLRGEGVAVPLRTLQRYLAPLREEKRVAEVATLRFETPPGQQLQVDFGERKVRLCGELVTVYLFVATLGFSRRLYVRAGLSQRQDEWKLGLEGALRHFGGRPQQVVVDNAKSLILQHKGGKVLVHPAFDSYCRDRELAVFACQPYRARTKGKVESGVKYVKRNAIAGRSFESLDALQHHLATWMVQADERIHGTTLCRPREAFQAHEAAALRPLHSPELAVATQHLRRVVANDCFIDFDRARYSVPHRLVRRVVEVTRTADEVIVRLEGREIARHGCARRPGERVFDPAHFAGLHRLCDAAEVASAPEVQSPLEALGRSLRDYADVIGGEA